MYISTILYIPSINMRYYSASIFIVR